jgi:hypothetical protein
MHSLHGDFLLENSCVLNGTPTKTQSTKENQAEFEFNKNALFQQAPTILEPLLSTGVAGE